MGAGVSYQKNVNTVAIQGAQGVNPPVVATLRNALYISQNITPLDGGSLTAYSSTINLANLDISIGDIRLVVLTINNQTNQAITSVWLSNFDDSFTNAYGVNINNLFYFYAENVGIPAYGTGQAIILIPYGLPLQDVKVNFQFASYPKGSVQFIGTFLGADAGVSPLLPISYTLSLAQDQEIIGAPGNGQRLYIYSVKAGNSSATLTILGLKYGGAANFFDQQPLAASGGGYTSNYKRAIQLPENVGLVANLTTAASYVLVNVEYLIAP